MASLFELRERMNQLFDELVHPQEATGGPTAFCPPADVYETADTFEICIDLPGVECETVLVEVHADAPRRLTVRGNRAFPCEESATVQRIERRYGPFLRAFELPRAFDQSDIARRCEEGVLRLSLRRVSGS